MDTEAVVKTRKNRRGGWRGPALAATSGILLYLAFPPAGQAWLAWVALVPLVIAALRSRPIGAFALGIVAGVTWFGGILDWIGLFGDPPFNTLLRFLASGFEALFLGLFALMVRLLLLHRSGRGFVLGVPALWAAVEWLRCAGPWGFPWGVLGETQVHQTTLIQCADVTGVWGVTFLIALVNGCVAGLLLSLATASADGTASRAPRRAGTVAVLSIALLVGITVIYGQVTPGRRTALGSSRLQVAVIQGNVERDDGWRREQAEQSLGIYGSLTRQIVNGRQSGADRPDLVIWPETVIPGDLRHDGELREAVAALARQGRCHLLVGTPHVDDQNRPKNSAALMGPEGGLIGWYDKVHLVPFGEYIPMRGWLPFLDRFPSVTDQYPGEGYRPLVMQSPARWRTRRTPPQPPNNGGSDGRSEGATTSATSGLPPLSGGWGGRARRLSPTATVSDAAGERSASTRVGPTRVGAMICFESAFPGISRTFVRRGAEILVVLTSDASFGRTAAAEHHAAKAVFRAIETRRWVVQAATTGISLAVDPGGRVRGRVGLFEAGTLQVGAGLSGTVTPYVRYGDWLVACCGLGIVCLGIARTGKREREGEE